MGLVYLSEKPILSMPETYPDVTNVVLGCCWDQLGWLGIYRNLGMYDPRVMWIVFQTNFPINGGSENPQNSIDRKLYF